MVSATKSFPSFHVQTNKEEKGVILVYLFPSSHKFNFCTTIYQNGQKEFELFTKIKNFQAQIKFTKKPIRYMKFK